MKVATSIQERLWELRKDKGLNLEELSKLTGISKSALGSYEKEDYKEINHGNLITLADFYNQFLILYETMHSLTNHAQTFLNGDRKSTRLNSSHQIISYAVFCLKKTYPREDQHSYCTWI